MKNIFLTILLTMATQLTLSAQPYWSKRYDLDTGNDYGRKAIQNSDQNILVQVNGFCELNTRDCYGLMMIDPEGTLLWKTIEYDSMQFDHNESMDIRNDTLFVHTNYIIPSYGTGGLIKEFNMDGIDIGAFAYNYPAVLGSQVTRELIVAGDRMYINYTYIDSADMSAQVHLRAYSPSWELLWEAPLPQEPLLLFYIDMAATPDSGIAMIFTHLAPGAGRSASIERYNKFGERLWTTHFSDSYGYGSLFATLTAHPDGSFFGTWNIDYFTGNPNKNRYADILFKLDASGNFVWQKLQQDKWENFGQVFVAQNGDIIGCGSAYNRPFTDPDWEAGYIRRMNTDGIEIWDRRIIDSTGGGYDFAFYAGLELANGDLLFSGEISSDTSSATVQDVWLVKTDANGCLTPGCQDTFQILVPTQELLTQTETAIFGLLPNPFRDKLVLGTLLGYPVPAGVYHAAVYDLQGRLVYAPTRINPDLLTEFDMAEQPAGWYVVQVFRDGVPVQALKGMKE